MVTFRIAVVLILICGLSPTAVLAADQTANVRFSVIRDYNGKPVRNASVVLHPIDRKGKQAYSGLQLKTDSEGNTNFDGVPYGMLRIQVLVPGFQTFGEDFEIDKPEMQITIKLKRPVDQYSTYGSSKPTTDKNTSPSTTQKPEDQGAAKPNNAQSDASPNKKNPETKPDEASTKPDATKDTSNDKPQN
ncbi:MAG TPA: carboxypeptidase-like regulatory domain-containing protein [Terriglobales bacterium]|jgi:hypothetical protein|nr:carboxypeptidase-like regulatory domain-containing protein [Terriglobales bacterium]